MGSKRGNGEGSIYQRKDGKWVASLTLPNGGRKEFHGKTRTVVARRLHEAKQAMLKGLPVSAGRLTVGAYLEKWLTEVARPSIKPSTFSSYQMICRRHLIPDFGRMRLDQLDAQSIQSYLNQKQSLGLSARTVQYHHAVLRRALGQAERLDLVPRNVAKLVTPPRVINREVRPFTPAEAKRLLIAVDGHRFEALYVLAIATGARQGELLALSWEDVDFDSSTVTIKTTLQYQDGTFDRPEPKSIASLRTLVVVAPAMRLLREHRVRQLELRLKAGSSWLGNPWDLVFTDQVGQPMSRFSVSRSFRLLLDRAGLPSQRFHDLRHSAATFMLTKGVPLKVVQKVLGHSQFGVTANIYGHVVPELQREAAEKVGELLWGVS